MEIGPLRHQNQKFGAHLSLKEKVCFFLFSLWKIPVCPGLPYPQAYSRMRLHAGGALVVWPGMLFPCCSQTVVVLKLLQTPAFALALASLCLGKQWSRDHSIEVPATPPRQKEDAVGVLLWLTHHGSALVVWSTTRDPGDLSSIFKPITASCPWPGGQWIFT